MKPSTRKSLVVATVTVIDVGCILVVACLGRTLVPIDPSTTATAPSAPAAACESLEGSPAAPRAPFVERLGSAENDAGAGESRTEAAFYAGFLAAARRGRESLEAATGAALAGNGPVCQQAAALRALCDTGSPAADDALVAAVLERPDVSSDRSDSLPRYALRCLAARAEKDPASRRALEGLVFGRSRPASSLRAAALTALCAVADEAEFGRIVESLRGETDELVLASAGTALSRHANPSAAEGEE